MFKPGTLAKFKSRKFLAIYATNTFTYVKDYQYNTVEGTIVELLNGGCGQDNCQYGYLPVEKVFLMHVLPDWIDVV